VNLSRASHVRNSFECRRNSETTALTLSAANSGHSGLQNEFGRVVTGCRSRVNSRETSKCRCALLLPLRS
jgi:hypothetical protein